MNTYRRRTVLVVDDAEDCTSTIDLALQALKGVSVLAAASAERAMELLAGGEVAALITDVNLPAMNGLDLIGWVRQQDRYRSLPILVVSADPNPSAPAEAIEAGANGFFPKPFSPGAVRRKLEELLEESVR